MPRELKEITVQIVSLPEQPFVDKDLTQWLLDYAGQQSQSQLPLRWLLAHADDGVIWGEIRGTDQDKASRQLALSSNAFPNISPELNPLTLQQLRLFSAQGELYLWRVSEGTFEGRLIDDTGQTRTDTEPTQTKYFDESQILWGDRLPEQAYQDGFSLVEEGQGLRHAVPLKLETTDFQNQTRPLRLKLRHYLDYDQIGQARISLSRLVSFF